MNCGRCHTCGAKLRIVLDGEEWCDECGQYRRYRSHGWVVGAATDQDAGCPEAGFSLHLGRYIGGKWESSFLPIRGRYLGIQREQTDGHVYIRRVYREGGAFILYVDQWPRFACTEWRWARQVAPEVAREVLGDKWRADFEIGPLAAPF